MLFLRPLGWLDVWALSVWLYKEQGSLRGEDGVRRLRLIDGAYRHPQMAKSNTVRNAVSRARRMAEQGNLELMRVEIEALDPGAHIPWQKAQAEIAVHVGIVPNPAATLYCGNEASSILAGQVVVRAGNNLWSAVNIGETSRYHLVLTLRERHQEDET